MTEGGLKLSQGRDDGDLVAQIVAGLEAAIQEGRLAPGQRLGELALAAELGVSRAPLREALRILEGRRLLRRSPNAGVRIVELDLADMAQLLTMREALEGLASRGAAENMTLAEIRGLEACLREEGRIETEGLGAVFRPGSTDNDFHLGIVRGSRNRWIGEILSRDLYALLRMYRYRSARLGRRGAEAHHEHADILEAIRARDADRAEALMRAHIRRGRDHLLAADEP